MTERDTKKRKSYRQVCSVAKALDVAGDRWTLLILRELLGGPARFHELEAGLPGIAKNLLTDRLRQLESDGIVRRASAGSSNVYRLSETGAAVRPVVEALGYWGAKLQRVGSAVHSRSLRSQAMALHTFLSRADAELLARPYIVELDIDGEPLEVALGPRPSVIARPSVNANALARVPADVIDRYLSGTLNAERFALVSGERAALDALLAALASPFGA